MKQHSRFAALLLLLFPIACGAPPQQRVPFPPQDVSVTRDDLTRIYMVREGWVGVGEQGVEVHDGDQSIGVVTSATYLCWERSPGRTLGRVFYHWGPGRGTLEGVADFDCAAGRAHYFQVTVDREGGKPTVQALDPEAGRRLVATREAASGS
jgi:hypothetical protein